MLRMASDESAYLQLRLPTTSSKVPDIFTAWWVSAEVAVLLQVSPGTGCTLGPSGARLSLSWWTLGA